MTATSGTELRGSSHPRKKLLQIYRDAARSAGSFDEWPVLPVGTDPMPYLSTFRVKQPCWTASEHDQLVIVMAGAGWVDLAPDRRTERLEVGDFLYLPAGVSARMRPVDEVIQLRYRADPAGWEAAIWYCEACGEELWAHEFDASTSTTDGLAEACARFGADTALRTCSSCATVATEPELGDIPWAPQR